MHNVLFSGDRIDVDVGPIAEKLIRVAFNLSLDYVQRKEEIQKKILL
jgi:hypothetical protein